MVTYSELCGIYLFVPATFSEKKKRNRFYLMLHPLPTQKETIQRLSDNKIGGKTEELVLRKYWNYTGLGSAL